MSFRGQFTVMAGIAENTESPDSDVVTTTDSGVRASACTGDVVKKAVKSSNSVIIQTISSALQSSCQGEYSNAVLRRSHAHSIPVSSISTRGITVSVSTKTSRGITGLIYPSFPNQSGLTGRRLSHNRITAM